MAALSAFPEATPVTEYQLSCAYGGVVGVEFDSLVLAHFCGVFFLLVLLDSVCVHAELSVLCC